MLATQVKTGKKELEVRKGDRSKPEKNRMARSAAAPHLLSFP